MTKSKWLSFAVALVLAIVSLPLSLIHLVRLVRVSGSAHLSFDAAMDIASIGIDIAAISFLSYFWWELRRASDSK